MRELFLNGEMLEIDEEIYFPFTYKADEPEHIFVEHTKTVEIPRTPYNDELFGYVAVITRVVSSPFDKRKGVRFNQIKKAEYSLRDGSEEISSGVLRIDNITDDIYEVTLIDSLTTVLDRYGETYLTDIDIDGFGLPATHLGIRNFNNPFIKPVFGIDEESEINNSSLFAIHVDSNQNEVYQLIDLPTECSQMNLRHFVASEVRYSLGLNLLFDALIDNGIHVSDNIMFSDIVQYHMLSNKPRAEIVKKLVYNTTPGTEGKVLTFSSDGAILNGTVAHRLTHNGNRLQTLSGKHNIRVDFNLRFTETAKHFPENIVTGYRYEAGSWVGRPNTTVTGQTIGELKFEVNLVHRIRNTQAIIREEEKQVITVPLTYKVNTFYRQVNDGLGEVSIQGIFYVNVESAAAMFTDFTTDTEIQVKVLNTEYEGSLDKNSLTRIFNKPSGYRMDMDFDTEYIFTKDRFYPGDYVWSETYMPMISLKDFILAITKTFDLRLYVKNEELYMDTKHYSPSNELLEIDKVTDLEVVTFDIDTLVVKHPEAHTATKDKYEELEGVSWAEKRVHTGYTIKSKRDELEVPFIPPFYEYDKNYFAYGRLNLHNTGGYSINPVGNFTDTQDKLVLGFPVKVKEPMYISNGDMREGQFYISSKVIKYAPTYPLMYQWGFNDNSLVGMSKLDEFYTFSPYDLNNNNVVLRSTELNKPEYSYAGIDDNNYPEQVTMYDKFYKQRIADKYNQDSHILTVEMFIDGRLDFYRVYNYENSQYIIYEVEEYDPTTPDLYTVKLKRING